MNNIQSERERLEKMVNNQIDPVSGLAINCSNCIHCEKIYSAGTDMSICIKCNTFCRIVHLFPTVYGSKCTNHSAWAPREKSIFELIIAKIRKFLT